GLCLVLRIRCCPSTTWPSLPWSALLARGRGRLAAWRRGVGPVRGGPGSVRRGRLVAAVTASSLLVPSGAGVFAWCSASVVARPLRGRHCPGRLRWLVVGGGCAWGVGGFGRCAGVPASCELVGFRSGCGFVGPGCACGVCEALGSLAACGPFCLVVPRFRPWEHETGTRRPAGVWVPGETAGQASCRALGVSSGSGFGPEERAGAGRGCETRHGHRPPRPPSGRPPPTTSQGSRPGQQRPRSGRATTDAKHQAKTPAPEGTSNDETAATTTTPPRRTDPGPTPHQPNTTTPKGQRPPTTSQGKPTRAVTAT
ncbi:hypothetical protein ABIA38_009008, partial [Embleya sp. AB8]